MKKHSGFIDFGPAFIACFIVGVLVGLTLPWLWKLLKLLIIWLAKVLS